MNDINPEYFQGMVGQLTRTLPFLIALSLFAPLGMVTYAIGGNAFSRTNPQKAAPERPAAAAPPDEGITNGVHIASGLVVAEGFETVKATCTACHSGKLVTQNRATREGWEDLIRWMQQTQGLWELGDQEKIILDYLAANYAPEETGRRAHLEPDEIQWYLLDQ